MKFDDLEPGTRLGREARARGASPGEVVELLARTPGYSQVGALVVIRAVFDLPYAEAKEIAFAHPAWGATGEATARLHDVIAGSTSADEE